MEDKERLSLEQELLELLKKRQGVQKDTLEDSRDFANVLQSQTKEIKEQIARDVLRRNDYYNGIINVRIGTPPKRLLNNT
jgi:hypothetical protein